MFIYFLFKITELGLLKKPMNIFNVDETGFCCDRGQKRVLVKKNSRRVDLLTSDSTKTHYTVEACVSADGQFLPLLVVYKAKTLMENWLMNGPPNCHYTTSKSGWMETDTFFYWFSEIFVPKTREITGPKLLFMYGHESHFSVKFFELARENDIHIICFPGHSSHKLQPLDVGVFKSVKTSWKQVLHEYFLQSNFSNVAKSDFPCLLKKIYENVLCKLSLGVNAFQITGIFPLDKERVKPTTVDDPESSDDENSATSQSEKN